MHLKLNKHHLYTLTILIISICLTLFWFRFGKMIAYAEEGVPFYRPDLIIEKYKYFWIEAGFGRPNPFYYPRMILFYFVDFLQNIGLTSWMTQSIVFFILLITPLVFMPKLVKELGYKSIVSYFSGFFYLFNLFTISQVWGRFILPLIFLWSYLPLFLYLWIKLIKSDDKKYLLYLGISSILYSYSFGIPSSIFVIFIPVLIFEFIYLLKTERKLKQTLNFSFYLVIWLIINFYWLYPAITISTNSLGIYLENSSSFVSLTAVSEYYPVNEIVFLKQRFLFEDNFQFKNFYSTSSAKLVSISILFFVGTGLLYSIRQYKKNMYFISLFLVSFLLIKGTNPPLGEEFYEVLFKYFPQSQVLRNPYEKAGALFVLPYSVMFSVGVDRVSDTINKRFLLLSTIFIIVFVWFMQPFWKGFVFPPHSIVDVPDYYKSADDYLNESGEGRIIQMPLLLSDVVEYDWRYKGGQHLDQLFSRPVIADPGAAQINDLYHQMRRNADNRNYNKLFPLLNVEHVIINNDIVITNPHDIRVSTSYGLVEDWNEVFKAEKFDALDIYAYEGEVNDRIFISRNMSQVQDLNSALEIILSDDFDSLNESLFINEQNPKHEIVISEFDQMPNYDITKINPEKYMLFVDEVQNPFYLILSETYNPLWSLSIADHEVGDHFVVNGFANGWYIDKLGSYEIEIEFRVWPWE